MFTPSRKVLRRFDLFGTFINLVGLAVGLMLMYYNYPDEAFIAIAISIGVYALVRVVVGYFDIESEERSGATAPSQPTGTAEPLTAYKAEITFTRSRE